ncbi:hypothetical protein [Palleronia caenipelagi]|uniref:Uncharacterized protein n=1 Tax=Palleronia caenipelagi TaxID=2489174 RepID=A0A547Q8P5_9RHOB|nr:hypothetical protein [Palleronia caenipelagi]TRD22755.1 hypothetical protein FEV53_02930 [Palleronia caenipelagi]
MNRTEFIVATALILFVAFALGWFANWLVHRMTRVQQSDLNELDNLARGLHEAEEQRDQAIAYVQEREAEIANQLRATEAELQATMDTVRQLRSENEEMRDYIEQIQARSGG